MHSTTKSFTAEEVRIVSIADCLEHLDEIINWHKAEWGEDWAVYARKATVRDGLPTMYVALKGKRPIGTSLLTHEDLPSRTDISPWLAGVYVAKEYRGKGVGALLVKHAMSQAASLQLPALFLFVHHASLQEFYSKFGWVPYEEADCCGEPVFIMKWELVAKSPGPHLA